MGGLAPHALHRVLHPQSPYWRPGTRGSGSRLGIGWYRTPCIWQPWLDVQWIKTPVLGWFDHDLIIGMIWSFDQLIWEKYCAQTNNYNHSILSHFHWCFRLHQGITQDVVRPRKITKTVLYAMIFPTFFIH